MRRAEGDDMKTVSLNRVLVLCVSTILCACEGYVKAPDTVPANMACYGRHDALMQERLYNSCLLNKKNDRTCEDEASRLSRYRVCFSKPPETNDGPSAQLLALRGRF